MERHLSQKYREKTFVTNSSTDFWHKWRAPPVSKGIVTNSVDGLLTRLARHFCNRSCQNFMKNLRQEHRDEHRRRTFDTDGNRQMSQKYSWNLLRHDLYFIRNVLRDEHRRRTFDTDGNSQTCQNYAWNLLCHQLNFIWLVCETASWWTSSPCINGQKCFWGPMT